MGCVTGAGVAASRTALLDTTHAHLRVGIFPRPTISEHQDRPATRRSSSCDKAGASIAASQRSFDESEWCPGAESNHRHRDFQFCCPG
jgi:hypothetical protein